MLLYLIRHPEPQIEPGVCYGVLDVPAKPAALTAAFAALLPQLAHCNGITIYTSPLQRCTALASALRAALPGSLLVTSPELIELNFGTWEGCSWDDIYANEGACLETWAAQPIDYAPGGGESLRQLHCRVITWLNDLRRSGCETAVVLTHGGPLRVLLSLNCKLNSSPNTSLSTKQNANEISPTETSLLAAYARKAPPWGSLNVVTIGGEHRVNAG